MAEGMGLTTNPLYPLSHCNYWFHVEFDSHLARAGLAANKIFRPCVIKHLLSKAHSACFVRHLHRVVAAQDQLERKYLAQPCPASNQQSLPT